MKLFLMIASFLCRKRSLDIWDCAPYNLLVVPVVKKEKENEVFKTVWFDFVVFFSG